MWILIDKTERSRKRRWPSNWCGVGGGGQWLGINFCTLYEISCRRLPPSGSQLPKGDQLPQTIRCFVLFRSFFLVDCCTLENQHLDFLSSTLYFDSRSAHGLLKVTRFVHVYTFKRRHLECSISTTYSPKMNR